MIPNRPICCQSFAEVVLGGTSNGEELRGLPISWNFIPPAARNTDTRNALAVKLNLVPDFSPGRLVHVAVMLDHRLAVLGPKHGDQVKTNRAGGRCGMGQETSGGLLNSLPLSETNCVSEILGVIARTCFDLDKHEGIVLGANQIDFACGNVVVAGKNPVTPAPQVSRGQALAAPAESQVCVGSISATLTIRRVPVT